MLLRTAACELRSARLAILFDGLEFQKGGLLMVVESVKKVKNIVSEVFKGYASNSSGAAAAYPFHRKNSASSNA